MLDMSILMDEILADACIFNERSQQSNLVRVARNPSLHPYLVSRWGMTPTLLDSLCQWSDVQNLLIRSSEQEVSFKAPLARKMLTVTAALFKWYRHRGNFPKALISCLPSLSLPEGVQVSEIGEVSDGEDEMQDQDQDQDTETEGVEGAGDQPDNDSDDGF